MKAYQVQARARHRCGEPLHELHRRYVDRITRELPGVKVMFMQSSGGLTDARRFHGKDSVLSGPAGGVVGMVRTGDCVTISPASPSLAAHS